MPLASSCRVGLDERRNGREMHAGARHELALEGVAVQIDDAGQNEKGFVRRLVDRGHRRDATLLDGDFGRADGAVGEERAAGEAGKRHRRSLKEIEAAAWGAARP